MVKTVHIFGFPIHARGEIKGFLEQITGDGSILAMKVNPSTKGGRCFAIVQFTKDEQAQNIMNLCKGGLFFKGSYLKARQCDRDIVPILKPSSVSLSNIKTHFGCQISNSGFRTLWQNPNTTVDFGFGSKKIEFLFQLDGSEYKLELFLENIWQIKLHNGRSTRFLVIQLVGAPRIYINDNQPCDDNDIFGISLVINYFREMPDQWVRSTDFPKNPIGQSSAMCLELHYHHTIPNLRERFALYKEENIDFSVQRDLRYCDNNLILVPIVTPLSGVDLPYSILFRICALVQMGCLCGMTLHAEFYTLIDPKRVEISYIEHALEKLLHLKECCYDPVNWLKEHHRRYISSSRRPASPTISPLPGLVYVRRVEITPCKIYFSGPEPNVSNRVIRHFYQHIENFLRVSFLDEEMGKLYSGDLSPKSSFAPNKRTRIYTRIVSVMRNGIRIGDKRFEFLAFSASQLRDNSAWFFAPVSGIDADHIRNWMGDFSDIRNIAKYAARMGQSLSSSTETINVFRDEVEVIADITDLAAAYVFSDGVGKISASFAEQVASKCDVKGPVPSVFQIRYGGYKGVVAVDRGFHSRLGLRKSMRKYESQNTKLDVLGWSKYQPCFLNRQIITLLSTLGVQDAVFLKKQVEATEQLDRMMTDPWQARTALELMAPGECSNLLKEMLSCGYRPDSEPFLSMMLQTFRASKLLDLKKRARIFIEDGRAMMGCLDETATLEYGQVFVQFSNATPGTRPGNRIISGRVVVAKNPCLHPGDVRVLEAVYVPELRHLVDCVVFPQKGHRPHPNECSGSDLDGDVYFVCWDPELVPHNHVLPTDYTPAPPVILDHPVTMEEVETYFADYIVNDSLGIIANTHTVYADKSPTKATCAECVELAGLFSVAVDFPKTGVPAVIPSRLHVRDYPDFMEKPDKPTYESQSVIGKLFRQVKDAAVHRDVDRFFTADVARRCYDPDMEYEGFEDHLDDAVYYKSCYDFKLGNLMEYYRIKGEAEVLSGSVMNMAKSFNQRRDSEAVSMAVRSLRKEARGWFDNEAPGCYAKASAWYHVTYHPRYWGCFNDGLDRPHFLSFPWCVYDRLVKIKRSRMCIYGDVFVR